MSEHREIVDTTVRLAWLADHRRWDELADVFAERVTVDYTSLNGGEPVTLAAADLIAGWRAGLGFLDATQHLVTNHLVEVDGDRAAATAQFQAVHVRAGAVGDPTWTLGGHYRFGLVRTDAGWRIDAMTMTKTWATGNRAIMTP
ncbi:nuclear transport factor 2 family protein [Actinosynnema sp. NPDC020468]|uniref:nuclear transport factor 2 family protein n=1 Tax=Actinosynnema sp. NPDC020468 TaxID=3154488 RepID=UPI0034085E56